MAVRTLYLCYFGLREPLVQTQVLPYLRHLAAAGVEVSLLTFEPELGRRWTPGRLRDEQARQRAVGIRWSCLPYHKRPSLPATAYDVLAGARFAARHARREGTDVLHARGHVPLAMALLARTLARCRVIFDIRGLWADEYADAGVWAEGSVPFRLVKWLERVGIRRADRLVVLTRRMRDWLVAEGLAPAEKVEVIPCCVDFARFGGGAEGVGGDAGGAAAGARENGGGPGGARRAERFEVVYAGAVTGLYMLEEMGRFFLEIRARRPDAFFRVLTTAPPLEAARVLGRAGLGADDFEVGAAPASEVPAHLRRARLGVSFRKPTFSQIAASPTKIPEYLAAGLPVVSNSGIGDVDALLEAERVGVVVRDFTPEELARAAERALALAEDAGTGARCVEAARRHFDLETVGGRAYADVYRRIGEGPGVGPGGEAFRRP